MSEINFTALTDEELKHYFLKHRDNTDAFHAYIDRKHARPSLGSIQPDDPDWESKLIASIQEKINK